MSASTVLRATPAAVPVLASGVWTVAAGAPAAGLGTITVPGLTTSSTVAISVSTIDAGDVSKVPYATCAAGQLKVQFSAALGAPASGTYVVLKY